MALRRRAPGVEFVGEVLRVDLHLMIQRATAAAPAVADRRVVNLVRCILQRFATVADPHAAGGENRAWRLVRERQPAIWHRIVHDRISGARGDRTTGARIYDGRTRVLRA